MSELKNYLRRVLWNLFGGEWSLVWYHLDGLGVVFYRMVSQIPIRCRFLRGAVRFKCLDCRRSFVASEVAGTFLSQQGDKIMGTCGYCMNRGPEPVFLEATHKRSRFISYWTKPGSNPT